LGERVCACVVPAAGTELALETLRQYLEARGFAYYKIPERLVILDALPIVGDKVDQRKLAEIAAAKAGGP
jgi:non-ribosomal peptide synthetase component E (peptide arylation enzyme)